MTFWLTARQAWLRAALAAMPILAVTGYLYFESRNAERLLLEAETGRQADNVALQLHAIVESALGALKGVANLAGAETAAAPTELARFAERVRADVPAIDSMAWANAAGQISQVYPANRPMVNLDPAGAIAQGPFAKALTTRRPAGSDVFAPSPGRTAVTLALPVMRDGQATGIVTAVVRLDLALRELYASDLRDLCGISLRDHVGGLAYADGGAPGGTTAERHVDVADRSWTLLVWPTPLFANNFRTSAPQRILGIGLAAALVAGAANYLLVIRARRLSESERESLRLAGDVERAQRHLSDLLNGIEAVVWESDLETKRFTFVNDFGRKLLGIDAAAWKPELWQEHVHPEDRTRVRENSQAARAPGMVYPIEYRMLAADNRQLWVSEIVTVIGEEGRPVGRRGVIVDITARVQAEEAVRQSQKLESLGVLAGGIAHDFNNLLTAILGNAEMLRGKLETGSRQDAREHLEKIERTTRRLAELTRQMLAYSGRGKFAVTELDLNGVITEMTELLSVSTPKNVHVGYQLDPTLPLLEADAAQLRQVVLNLLTNASEAIGEQARGEVIIRTRPTVLDEAEIETQFPGQELEPGRFAMLEVSDTGCGMSPETLSKIFDPFFTTKFTGRGLGLAALRGIVRSHKGGIRIFSEAGEGTVFTLVFPASKTAQGNRPRPLERPRSRSDRPRAVALVIDDEESLRSVMIDALKAAGFDTYEAGDGEEGVAVFRRHAAEVDIVVLDLTMPRMNGDEALARITEIRSDVCVILSSGYTQEEVDRQFTGRNLAGFIEKPFTPSELVAKIRKVLEDRRARENSAGGWPRDDRQAALWGEDGEPEQPGRDWTV